MEHREGSFSLLYLWTGFPFAMYNIVFNNAVRSISCVAAMDVTRKTKVIEYILIRRVARMGNLVVDGEQNKRRYFNAIKLGPQIGFTGWRRN